jgi:thiol-disulfide isomerase/thioredoxin
MKPIISFLAALCLFINATAQENITNKGIRIGQAVPDVTVTGATGLKIHNQAVTSFRFSQLKGKLVILDFWATWCAPCRKMAPVLDSLQKQFGDQVLFIQVAYESAATIAPVQAAMQKVKPFQLPGINSDQILNQLFPHRSLPHFVWIDQNDTVKAITEEKEVTAANIRKMLQSADQAAPALAVKQDSVTAYDPAQPLLIAGNGGSSSGLVYHSLLSTYKSGLASGVAVSAFDKDNGQHFTARNVPFPWLCRLAFGENGRVFPSARTRVLSKDSLRMDTRLTGRAFNEWLAAGNGWCYELVLPPALATSAYPFMQADLLRLFPRYLVSVERHSMKCLALVLTGKEDKLKSAGGETSVTVTPYKAGLRNAQLSQLMMRLERQYLQNSRLPVVDATGYTGRVDLAIEAKLYDVPDLNRALAPYGLTFMEKVATVEVLVISDASRDEKYQKSTKPKP